VNALRQNLDTSSFKDKFRVVVVLILHTLQQHRLATHHMAHPENCSCGHGFLKESLIALNLKFQVGNVHMFMLMVKVNKKSNKKCNQKSMMSRCKHMIWSIHIALPNH
jgi:hypothetical protein